MSNVEKGGSIRDNSQAYPHAKTQNVSSLWIACVQPVAELGSFFDAFDRKLRNRHRHRLGDLLLKKVSCAGFVHRGLGEGLSMAMQCTP